MALPSCYAVVSFILVDFFTLVSDFHIYLRLSNLSFCVFLQLDIHNKTLTSILTRTQQLSVDPCPVCRKCLTLKANTH
jgi:hypothetical protein